MKFPEFSWNFINFMKFHEFHQVWAPRRWHAERTVIPMVFQWLQRAHSSPGTPKSDFSLKYWFRTKFLGIFMKFGEVWPQNWTLRILKGPWPARAGNLNIPIGILRFLSLPGSHGFSKTAKTSKLPPKSHFSTPKLVFPLPGLKKTPERYVYVGFWAGAANVAF